MPVTVATHYRNRKLCRVPRTLPSVLYRALGKGCLYRVPKLEHSTKTRPSAKLLFAECSEVTLGKDFLCRVSTSHTRQILARRQTSLSPSALCRVYKGNTRQSIIFFGSCTSKIFTSPHTTCGTPCLSLVYF